jgi:predicted acetyltransferase
VDIEIRRATAADFPAIVELDGASFGFHYSAEELADAVLDVAPEGFVLASDRLTWVSVELTSRRRGVLRSVIESRLRAHAEAGLVATVLTASEGGIYGRYGFGVASNVRRTVIDRTRSRLAAVVDTSAVRRLTTEQARDLLPELHGGSDGPTCQRTDGPAELSLGVDALGAVCLGGTRLAQLARAGQVSGDAAAITRLDRG